MYIKAGVDISRLNPEIRRTLGPVSVILRKEKVLFVVSSTFEGNHSPHSKHYANDAYDISATVARYHPIFIAIKHKLGSKFDVVFEKTHIHIEYDPKS
ncbi:hypothetical protein LCGC14_2578560 [marine sediment metagenome]|uniref:Peptidase M15A C-terminal domain-containing protein n=1 Tax=marine sediment metagenome TaxID=412755 RepID=A0A0F9CR73_9ZZZZ